MALAYNGYSYWFINRIQQHKQCELVFCRLGIDYTWEHFIRMLVLDYHKIVEVINVCSSWQLERQQLESMSADEVTQTLMSLCGTIFIFYKNSMINLADIVIWLVLYHWYTSISSAALCFSSYLHYVDELVFVLLCLIGPRQLWWICRRAVLLALHFIQQF